MKHSFVPILQSLTPAKELYTLVEHRSVYAMDHCEMNIFETRVASDQFRLKFSDLVFTAMLRGKKVMDVFNKRFDYFPGESVVVPGNQEMVIDFPNASEESPTQCVALAIDEKKISQTLELLNDQFAKAEENDSWKLDAEQYHLQNTEEIARTVDRLVRISKEDNKLKDVFADMALRELLVRLMQTQARTVIIDNYKLHAASHRFAYVVQYIKENIAQNITVEKLSDLACMSKSHFFRSFKRELGISPVDYVLRERMKLAKKFLLDPLLSITDASYRSGFQSVSYFSTLFKKYEGITPKSFKKSMGFSNFTE